MLTVTTARGWLAFEKSIAVNRKTAAFPITPTRRVWCGYPAEV